MIDKALMSLRPNSQWSIFGETYEGIEWLDQVQTKPTKDEVMSEVARLQAEYELNKYQRDRAKEYPSVKEQLDMQYWDSVNGTTVWQDTINAIKAKYPKVG